MATTTPNYGLTKPDLSELYDIGVQNTNMDIIDTALNQQNINYNDLVNSLYIKSGDVIDLRNGIYVGILTGGWKTLQFTIPLNRPIDPNVSRVSVDSVNVEVRHSDGGYIAQNVSLASIGSVSASISTGRNTVLIQVDLTNAASSFANNSVCALKGYTTFTLTFS